MLCGLADGVEALVRQGATVRRVLLVGGAAAAPAVRAIAPTLLGVPVHVPPPGEYVADGAALQAAWVLDGGARPPQWERSRAQVYEAEPQPEVRAAYAAARVATHPGT
jgi:xylulokinase